MEDCGIRKCPNNPEEYVKWAEKVREKQKKKIFLNQTSEGV